MRSWWSALRRGLGGVAVQVACAMWCGFAAPGCANKYAEMESPYAYDDYEEAEYDDYGGMDERAAMASAPAPAMSGKRSTRGPAMAPAPPPPPAPPGEAEAVDPAPAVRMVYYNGYAHLLVDRTDDAADAVVAAAAAAGGRVEDLGSEHVTVRVPVARFDEVMAAVLELGDVIDKSISATDVTESFQSVSLRLRTASATRERLLELLELAKDEQQKISILQQIQRLTEQIDVLEAQVRTLGELAAMSRITVQLTGRQAFTDRPDDDGLYGLWWIARLNPFDGYVLAAGKRLALSVPDGMVPLDIKQRLVAESADGAVFRTGRLDNDPQGDAAWWIDAARERLADGFVEASVEQVGEFVVLRLVDRGGEEAYRWLIGVRADGRHLDVVEAFLPSADHEARYGDAIRASLMTGAPGGV